VGAERGTDLIGQGHGHDALFEGGARSGRRLEQEPAHQLPPGQHGQYHPVRGQLELEVALAGRPVAAPGDHPLALERGDFHHIRERRRLEPAIPQAEQRGELRLGRLDYLRAVRPPGDEPGEAVDAAELAASRRRLRLGRVGPPGQLPDHEAHDEEEDGRFDVVLGVDGERQVGPGVEEVE
jgi:hypothetical protein